MFFTAYKNSLFLMSATSLVVDPDPILRKSFFFIRFPILKSSAYVFYFLFYKKMQLATNAGKQKVLDKHSYSHIKFGILSILIHI